MELNVTIMPAFGRAISGQDVRRLYDGAGWWPGWDPDEISRAIDASVAVGAWDGERLVGFVRALSDSVHRAYIEDVVIDPECRGQGIGERLVAALIELLEGVHIVSLFCEPDRVSFYARNGFRAGETQVMMHLEPDAPGLPGALDRRVYDVPQHQDT
jgi:ribosomal protein S18 acetylase RimI-like enzyme